MSNKHRKQKAKGAAYFANVPKPRRSGAMVQIAMTAEQSAKARAAQQRKFQNRRRI